MSYHYLWVWDKISYQGIFDETKLIKMKTLLTCISLLLSSFLIAQPSFKKKTLSEYESSSDRQISVIVEIPMAPANQEDFTIVVDLDNSTASYSDYDFSNKKKGYPINFLPAGSLEHTLQFTIKSDGEDEPEEKVKLILNDSNGNKVDETEITIKSIEAKHTFKEVERYISLGGTFDFAEGQSKVNRYSEIMISTPYFSLSDVDDKKIFRLHTGYQNGTANSQDSLTVNIEETIYNNVGDSTFLQLDQSGSLSISRKYKYFSIFARPGVRLTHKDSKAKFELLANFEFIRRTVTRDYSTTNFNSDTTTVIISPDDQDVLDTRSLFPPYLSSTVVNNEGYLGGGFNFTYDWPKTHVFLNTTFNYALHDLARRTPNDSPNFRRLAYVTQFGLMQKDIGLKLGGEFRAKALDDHPVVTIYLAKMFSISKLREFVTSF
jgi:hypothetical protein